MHDYKLPNGSKFGVLQQVIQRVGSRTSTKKYDLANALGASFRVLARAASVKS